MLQDGSNHVVSQVSNHCPLSYLFKIESTLNRSSFYLAVQYYCIWKIEMYFSCSLFWHLVSFLYLVLLIDPDGSLLLFCVKHCCNFFVYFLQV